MLNLLLGVSEEDIKRMGDKIGKTLANLNEFLTLTNDVLNMNIATCKRILEEMSKDEKCVSSGGEGR